VKVGGDVCRQSARIVESTFAAEVRLKFAREVVDVRA
jgi:hypothetical protein